MQINLVFEGGGVKGIAHVGALHAIQNTPLLAKLDVEVMAVGGSSAGAIIAALYAVGYTASEMQDELKKKPLWTLIGRKPNGVQSLARILRHKGVYSTQEIWAWLSKLLSAKKVTTDGGLVAAQQKRFGRSIPCRLVATDVTGCRTNVYDATQDDGAGLAKAVLRSLSIPIFFQPYQDGHSLYVDGGVVSNYPTWLYRESDYPTIGLRLRRDAPEGARADSGVMNYLASLMNTMLSGNDERERLSPRLREILIQADIVSSTNFRLSPDEEQALFEAGQNAAIKFDWTDVPSTRGCVFNDPRAAVVLENTAATLSEIVRSPNRVGKRHYEYYEETWTCLPNGGGVNETRFRLRNEGTDPTSILRFTIGYDEPVGVSFDDLKFEITIEPSDRRVMILPLQNKSELKEYALWFLPPIAGGEFREVTVKVVVPKVFDALKKNRVSMVSWELEHETVIDRALLEVKIPKIFGPVALEAPQGSDGSRASITHASDHDDFTHIKWTLRDLHEHLNVAAKLFLK